MNKIENLVTREDFPIFKQEIHGKRLAYLDNGATTHKPRSVIEVMSQYYETSNANAHRGVYALSERSTAVYGQARETIQQFIQAVFSHEIIFTKGTTEAINLVASCLAQTQVKQGDEVLISTMEHHSNIVPWQILCERVGAILKVIPLNSDGSLDLVQYRNLLTEKTRIVSVTHVSNVLGTINPIREIIALAHEKNIPVLIDGAQAVSRIAVNVQELDCDFYVFSSHKMYGPMGVGVLYGKTKWLEKMPPYQGGGDMIRRVSFEKTEYNELPYKFEAGTPNVAGVVGLAQAVEYLRNVGLDKIFSHEKKLTEYALQQLTCMDGLQVVGAAKERIGVISFVMEEAHPHDIATILDREGVAIRAGHHCAMPLLDYLKVPATARLSLGIYNDQQDIDQLIGGLKTVNQIFGVKNYV